MLRIILSLLLCLSALSGHAADGDKQTLIDELRQLSEQSREQRSADRWLQQALDDLVTRYDWPWRKDVVFDNFADGDFEQLPRWQTINGRFWVARGNGLRSRVEASSAPPSARADQQPSLEEAVIGALLQQALGDKGRQNSHSSPSPPSIAEPNEILLRAPITNAFAIEAEFTLKAPDGNGRFALALLQGDNGRYGYRLRLLSGHDGFAVLERVSADRFTVVKKISLPLDIGDNLRHRLAWRQTPHGDVTMELDAQPLFTMRDKVFRDGYQQLVLSLWTGDLTLHSIRISGTDSRSPH